MQDYHQTTGVQHGVCLFDTACQCTASVGIDSLCLTSCCLAHSWHGVAAPIDTDMLDACRVCNLDDDVDSFCRLFGCNDSASESSSDEMSWG